MASVRGLGPDDDRHRTPSRRGGRCRSLMARLHSSTPGRCRSGCRKCSASRLAVPIPMVPCAHGARPNQYTLGAGGAPGSLSGGGRTLALGNIGGDGRGTGIVFTYQPLSGRYYSSSYGYLDQLTYHSSGRLGDTTNLSLFGTSNLTLAAFYATNAYDMEQIDAAGYLGSATVVTQPNFTTAVPSQATPNSIATVADSFVGQAWNMNGCWYWPAPSPRRRAPPCRSRAR